MDWNQLKQTALFGGCSTEELEQLSKVLQFAPRSWRKGERILCAGAPVRELGVVLSGRVQIENNDAWGNKSILGMVEAGGVFAEAYACLPDEPLMVDVVAQEDCEVLMVDIRKVLADTCPVCRRVTQNLVRISARKNLNLSQRIFHTSAKTIRGRLISFFSNEVTRQGSKLIRLSMNRQQLADYLSLDRSALCKELGKMKRDGLLDYHKNTFKIMT